MRAVDSPAMPVVPLDEIRHFLRLEHPHEDALLGGLVRAATVQAEAFLGRRVLCRLWEEELPEDRAVVRLEASPVREVVLVERLLGGEWLPLDTGWTLALCRQGAGTFSRSIGGRLRVRYRAGLAESWADTPEALRLGIMRLAAHAFDRRDGRDADERAMLPGDVRALLAPWRTRRLA